ncbi:MAG: T9SS type A sorting domain-containing protein, partial [Bacteroidia bacterium]
FTGTFFFADSDGSYPHSSKDASLDHLSHCEYWTLDRNAGTSGAVVTLSWNTTSCGVTNLADLRVARWDGSAWRDHGNGGTSGNTVAGSLTSSGTISSFSPFTLSSSTSENPLPINLVDFSAVAADGTVDVTWTTASETNNDYFVVEASKDAREFNEVATVDGAGNSNAMLNYQIKDSNPFAGVSYYRLKQVDFNGEFTYSDIQAVNTPSLWQNEIIVSPNPVVGTANVLLDPVLYQNPNIEIRDLQGRVVKNIGRVEIKGFNQVQVDMTDMKAGLYFVYVQEAGRVAVSRVIRN